MATETIPTPSERDWYQRGHDAAMWDMAPLRESHHNLLEILVDLADLQNGPPLPKDAADWREVMAAARDAIATAEALEKGEVL